jgi:Flp pilus assembly protein TadG
MNGRPTHRSTVNEARTMKSDRISRVLRALTQRSEGGQVIVIFGLALVAIVAMVALIVEGGNAFAQQRITQNGADAASNAGAVVLAQDLGSPGTKSDADVDAAVDSVAALNNLVTWTGYYTNVAGQYVSSGGAVVGSKASAAVVGAGAIPPGAQGVRLGGTRAFDTSFARVLGITSMNASADATAVAGRLVGGAFLPVIFPINIVDCEVSGSLGTGEANWKLSNPDGPDAGSEPDGQEYIVPLCKTGGGSFQILDLDPSLRCDDEIASDIRVQWPTLPVDVPSDNGNNCAKPIAEYVNANFQGKVVFIPICEVDCVTTGGSKAFYTVVKVAAFYLDYMEDSNNKNNSACQGNGSSLITIAGNGSSSCVAGWFVRYITAGPVGAGPIGNSDAVGVQLIH